MRTENLGARNLNFPKEFGVISEGSAEITAMIEYYAGSPNAPYYVEGVVN